MIHINIISTPSGLRVVIHWRFISLGSKYTPEAEISLIKSFSNMNKDILRDKTPNCNFIIWPSYSEVAMLRQDFIYTSLLYGELKLKRIFNKTNTYEIFFSEN